MTHTCVLGCEQEPLGSVAMEMFRLSRGGCAGASERPGWGEGETGPGDLGLSSGESGCRITLELLPETILERSVPSSKDGGGVFCPVGLRECRLHSKIGGSGRRSEDPRGVSGVRPWGQQRTALG